MTACRSLLLMLIMVGLQCLQSDSLQCYSCLSEQLCAIRFKETTCEFYCHSYRYKKEGIKFHEKGCEKEGMLAKPVFLDYCRELVKNKTVHHCYACNTDLCNKAPDKIEWGVILWMVSWMTYLLI